MSKRKKSYAEMNTAELAEATKDLDREVVDVRGRPLTPAEKKIHRDAAKAAKRKRGRPIQGEGARVIAASIEGGLLKQADAYAKRHKLGRSELVTEALRALLAKAG
jgi:hypothetical protein